MELQTASESRLIVGLGNPGKRYTDTRHNLGFLVVQQLAQKHRLKIHASSFCKALTAEGLVADTPCGMFFPMTYMNHSGEAVKQIVQRKGFTPDHLLVVCDDLNLPFCQLRLRRRGSDGGHNGLSSIIEHLQSDDFARLRLGIGIPPSSDDAVDYVLESFTNREKKALEACLPSAVACCEAWLTEPFEQVANRFNQKIN